MSSRSSKRDHVNAFVGFQVHNRNGDPIQQTQGDETLLAIRKAIVFVGRCESFKYAPRIGEVKPVISEICLSLTLIPRKAHLRTVYTSGKAVKRRNCCALTFEFTGSARLFAQVRCNDGSGLGRTYQYHRPTLARRGHSESRTATEIAKAPCRRKPQPQEHARQLANNEHAYSTS